MPQSPLNLPKTRPEILSPAGDWDAMRAAVANGADSVYFGLDQFNARHRATNFTLEELPKVMAFLHSHNVKGFLTFNTLIFSDEMEAAVEYIGKVAVAGVDAVIVQDLGIAKLIHKLAPTLHIHGSTQMTLTEPEGIKFVKELGVERVVLARELGLKEIAKITAATDMPLEVFVHGALCVAYSGQCLTSESLGGRSANRGQCAQACRLPYQLIVDGEHRDLGDKAYLVSPSDLAAYELIGELTDLGVVSFKIEGRLKSAQYVAATTQTYRAAVDAKLAERPFTISDEQEHALEQTFSRGFTNGFLSGVNHQRLVSATSSNARGTLIGTVAGSSTRGVTIELNPTMVERAKKGIETVVKAGDGLMFAVGATPDDHKGTRVYGVSAPAMRQNGRTMGIVNTRYEVTFPAEILDPVSIPNGTSVFKTDDPALKRKLETSYSRDDVANRSPVDFEVEAYVGATLRVTGRAGNFVAVALWEERPLEEAKKFPFTVEAAREGLSRLGETPFELGRVTLLSDGEAMVPKSVLNDLRRKVIESLLQQRQLTHAVSEPRALEILREEARSGVEAPAVTDYAVKMHVLARSMDQLHAVLNHASALKASMIYADFEDVRRYPEAIATCRAAGVKIALATLRIVKPGEEGFLKQVSDCEPDALLVRHLGAIHYYQHKAPHLPLIGDYALNIANELTAKIFMDAGLTRVVPSYDLNWQQLAAMLRQSVAERFECVIHQHMPMFHMEHCVFAHTLSTGTDYLTCGRPCEKHRVELTDRVGEPHPLVADVGCRNTLFNARAQTAAEYIPDLQKLGIWNFRIELLRESAAETVQMLDRYTRLMLGEEKPLETLRSLRVLNQLGVTRGTMAHE